MHRRKIRNISLIFVVISVVLCCSTITFAKATNVDAKIEGTKKHLTEDGQGKPFYENTFMLKATGPSGDQTINVPTSDIHGIASWSLDVSFSAAGNYEYHVKEIKPQYPSDFTRYDDKEYKIIFSVTSELQVSKKIFLQDQEVDTIEFTSKDRPATMTYNTSNIHNGDFVNIGTKIPYKLHAYNNSNLVANIDYYTNVLFGLESPSDIKAYDSAGKTVAFTTSQEEQTTGLSFGIHFANVPKDAEYTVELCFIVTDKVFKNPFPTAQNGFEYAIEGQSTAGNSLTNVVPNETSDHTGKFLKPGDVISYKASAGNYTGDTSKLTIKNTINDGLEYDLSEGSFYYENSQMPGEKTPFTPTISEDGKSFTYTLEDLYDFANIDFYFSCKVKSTLDFKASSVSSLKINNGQFFNTPVLDNAVPNNISEEMKLPGACYNYGDVINYNICTYNVTNTNNIIKFTESINNGLTLIDNSFKIHINDEVKDIQVKKTDKGFSYDATVDTTGKVILSFSCKVNEEALEKYYIETAATIQLNNDEKIEAEPLRYSIPVKQYVDKSLIGKKLNVGDTVEYKVICANYTGEKSDMVIKDEPSEGLIFDKSSFKIKIGDDEEKDILPEIQNNKFTHKLKDIDDETIIELTYKCYVDEAAYNSLSVNNKAKIGVAKQADFEVSELSNIVNAKPEVMHQASSTGDKLIFIFSILLFIVGFSLYYKFRNA